MRQFMNILNETYVDPEASLKADYADLGVSCGYVGGVHIGNRDDRSFCIFTDVYPTTPKPYEGNGRISITVFDVPRDQGVWKEKIQFDTPENRAKLDAIRERVASGELYVRK